jgi:hypothetical protein
VREKRKKNSKSLKRKEESKRARTLDAWVRVLAGQNYVI